MREKNNVLVLSLFPGIGLLDRAFEEEGFCVVRGPDLLWGGDIKVFHPPAGRFDGVIGGPPCQEFSPAGQITRPSVDRNLIPEFERVVLEAQPEWFLMENVRRAPVASISDYKVHSFLLNNRWLGEEQNRERRFCFGTRTGKKLIVPGDLLAIFEAQVFESCVLASEGKSGRTLRRGPYLPRRSWEKFCELQGLPGDFLKDSPFTIKARYKVVGNGVPLPMGRAIAKATRQAIQG
jgi:DNA (cytosine-5)-methyltransferase 1